MPDQKEIRLSDRFAIAFVSANFGLVTFAIIWVATALVAGEPAAPVAAFAFCVGAFAVAGFLIEPPFGDALGVWFQGICTYFSPWASLLDSDTDPEPFRPVWASVFLVGVVAITIWLSLP